MPKIHENDHDLSVFFNDSDFGDVGIFTTETGVTRRVNGQFLNEFEASVLFESSTDNSKPVFICRTDEVPEANNKCSLKIGTVTLYIMNVHPDQTGVTTLVLSEDNVD